MTTDSSKIPRRRPWRLASAALVALVGLLLGAPMASAQDFRIGQFCLEDAAPGARPWTCEANDVRLSALNVLNGVTQCNEGELIDVMIEAEFVATSNLRYDVGMFVDTGGGNAIDSGNTCFHTYFPPPLSTTLTPENNPGTPCADKTCTKIRDLGTLADSSPPAPFDPFDADGDTCGDIEQLVLNIIDLPTIQLTCKDDDNDGFLDVGTCTSWNQNAQDVCMGLEEAVPGSPAKCRCEPRRLEIEVNRVAYIEVEKHLIPSTDTGKFNLQIDGVTEFADAVDGSTTNPVEVTAGTSVSPGDMHYVGETAGTGTSLDDYDSQISCKKCADTFTMDNPPTSQADCTGGFGAPVVTQDTQTDPFNVLPGEYFVCTVENIRPSVTIDKVGDDLSKVGDDVSYTITTTNTSPGGLSLSCTISDPLLGINVTKTLDPNVADVINDTYTVLDTDPNPLTNTATVSCTFPSGQTEVASDSDGHSVPLFEPSISFDKSGDSVSKIGDSTDYTITLTNTSSANTPDLTCTVTDAAIGVDEQVVLASGDPAHVINASAPIPANADDPYVNEASVSCTVAGFPNVLNDSDDHSVNLFQPSITFDKTGDAVSKVGDSAAYVITLNNTSSGDTPDLTCTITDTTTGVNEQVVLASGAPAHVINTSVTIQAGASDPFLNTANVSCSVAGFPNVLTASNDHSVDLVQPAFTIAKSCTNQPVPQEGSATWDILVSNTGNVALVITVTDDLLPGGSQNVSLAANTSTTLQVSDPGPFSGQTTVSNTASATAVVDPSVGVFSNVVQTPDSTAECIVGGRVNLLKLTNGIEDPNMIWTFNLYEGPDGFGTTVLASDSTPPALLDFGNINLDPAKTYTICESEVPPAWSTMWKVDTTGDGVADTIIMPYNPNADDNPPANLGNQCFDFGAGTAYPVPQGGTLVFEVDNTMDGGEPRTPGYWKNWNTCTGGNQANTAAHNGGPSAGWFILDDILTSPGVTWDDILADDIIFSILTCEDGVSILDQRDIITGKKNASDAAYTLAMHLLAAQLNFAAGAETCQEAQDAALAGELLLDEIDFIGTGKYLRPKDGQLYQDALDLAFTLDQYNNGLLCP